MAIFVEGTECPICGKPIYGDQEHVAFPPFAPNQLDPIFFFDDGVFHADCFYRHPLADKALGRLKELKEHTRIWPPPCALCHRIITDPDEYFTFGHLTEDRQNPLYKYNYMQMHRSCMKSWNDFPRVYALIEELQRSGYWGGSALNWLLEDMRKIRAS